MFIEYAHDDVGEDDNECYGDDDGAMTLNGPVESDGLDD